VNNNEAIVAISKMLNVYESDLRVEKNL
jgi:hypothetical protein